MRLVAEYKIYIGQEIHLKRFYTKFKNRLIEVTKKIVEYSSQGYIIKNIKPEKGLESVSEIFFHVKVYE